MNKLQHYINGKFQSHSQNFFEKISPVTEKILYLASNADLEDVSFACESAQKAFASWNKLGPVQRGEWLFQLADQMQFHKLELVNAVVADTGKSQKDAIGEIEAAIAQCRFMAGEGRRFGGRVVYGASYNKSVLVERRPYGVAFLIIASNTPIANILWKLAPALICGNTVVLKSSEDAPNTSTVVAQIIDKMKWPEGVFNLIHGQGQIVGASLVKQKNLGVVSFTGSTRAGKWIKGQLIDSNANVFLEMGGKNPLVIFGDADLENAVKWSLLSSFSNAGQRCASSSRILIHSSLYSKFKDLFVTKTKNLKVGSQDQDDLGPVINKKQFEFILKTVREAVEITHAKILCGGIRHGELGFYIQPTIVENLSMRSELSQMEIFGPVTCLYSFDTYEQAVALANNSQYGLTSAVHTRDINLAMKFSRDIEAGVCSINGGTHGSEAHMPFGGVKNSGNGLREPGEEALDVYSYKMNLVINTI